MATRVEHRVEAFASHISQRGGVSQCFDGRRVFLEPPCVIGLRVFIVALWVE